MTKMFCSWFLLRAVAIYISMITNYGFAQIVLFQTPDTIAEKHDSNKRICQDKNKSKCPRLRTFYQESQLRILRLAFGFAGLRQVCIGSRDCVGSATVRLSRCYQYLPDENGCLFFSFCYQCRFLLQFRAIENRHRICSTGDRVPNTEKYSPSFGAYSSLVLNWSPRGVL